jgi:probable rRNA maturation factor
VSVTVALEVGDAGLDERAVARAAEEALREGGRPELELSVALVDDHTLAELHDRYLGDPAPTDVMSFDLSDEHCGAAGEVLVSVERAREVAAARGQSLAREVALYVVHGTLHLCGYDDHDPRDRQRMRDAEARVLGRLGYAEDRAPHDL